MWPQHLPMLRGRRGERDAPPRPVEVVHEAGGQRKLAVRRHLDIQDAYIARKIREMLKGSPR